MTTRSLQAQKDEREPSQVIIADLENLNHELCRLFGIMAHNDEELASKLFKAYRSLMIIQMLSDRRCVAVTGVQGVGKSTLVKNLLAINDAVFPTNLGRGEKLPLLVVPKEPAARVQRKIVTFSSADRFRLGEKHYESSEEYQSALMNPDKDMLYGLVEVHDADMKLWESDVTFMLLPGFEERDNEGWQEVVRRSAMASSCCIVAFNATSYAQQTNKKYIDWIRGELDMNGVLLAMTGADRSTDDNAELRSTVLGDLGIADEARAAIVSVGVFPDGMPWRDEVKKHVLSMLDGRARIQRHQYDNIYRAVMNDVMPALKRLENLEESRHGKHLEERMEYEKFIQPFHDEQLRVRKKMEEHLERRLNEKSEIVKKALKDDAGSVSPLKKLRSTLGDTFRNHLKVRGESINKVVSLWQEKGVDARDMVVSVYSIALEPHLSLLNAGENGSETKSAVAISSDGTGIHDVVRDLRILFHDSNEEWSDMSRTLILLPSIILNMAALKYDGVIDVVKDGQGSAQLAGNWKETLADKYLNRTPVLNLIGGILGLDGVIDGKIDSVPKLISAVTGITAATIPQWVFSAVSGFLTAGLLVVNVKNAIQRSIDRDVQTHGAIVDSIRHSQHAAIMRAYDDAIEAVRERLQFFYAGRHNMGDELGRTELLSHRRKKAQLLANAIADNSFQQARVTRLLSDA